MSKGVGAQGAGNGGNAREAARANSERNSSQLGSAGSSDRFAGVAKRAQERNPDVPPRTNSAPAQEKQRDRQPVNGRSGNPPAAKSDPQNPSHKNAVNSDSHVPAQNNTQHKDDRRIRLGSTPVNDHANDNKVTGKQRDNERGSDTSSGRNALEQSLKPHIDELRRNEQETNGANFNGAEFDRRVADNLDRYGHAIDRINQPEVKNINDVQNAANGVEEVKGVNNLRSSSGEPLRGFAYQSEGGDKGGILLDNSLNADPDALRSTATEEVAERFFQETFGRTSNGDFGAEVSKRVSGSLSTNEAALLRSENDHASVLNQNGRKLHGEGNSAIDSARQESSKPELFDRINQQIQSSGSQGRAITQDVGRLGRFLIDAGQTTATQFNEEAGNVFGAYRMPFTPYDFSPGASELAGRETGDWNGILGVSGAYNAYSDAYDDKLSDVIRDEQIDIPDAATLQRVVNEVNDNVSQTTNTPAGDHQPAYYDSDNDGTVDYIRIRIGNTNNHAWYVAGDQADIEFKRISIQAAIDAGVAERIADTRPTADPGSTVTRPTSAVSRITGNIPKEIEDTGDILTDIYTKDSLENDFKDSLRNLNDLLVGPELYLQTAIDGDSSTSTTSTSMHDLVDRLNKGLGQLEQKTDAFTVALAQAKERGYSDQQIALWVEQTLKNPSATASTQTVITQDDVNNLITQKKDTYFNKASETFDGVYEQFSAAATKEDAARISGFLNAIFGLIGGVSGSFAAIKGIVKSVAGSAKSVAKAQKSLDDAAEVKSSTDAWLSTPSDASRGNYNTSLKALTKEKTKARVAGFDNAAAGGGLAVGDAYILKLAIGGLQTPSPTANNLSPEVAEQVARVRSEITPAQRGLYNRLNGFFIDNFDEHFTRADVVVDTYEETNVGRWQHGSGSSGYSNKYRNYASKPAPDAHTEKVDDNREVADQRNRQAVADGSNYRYVVIDARYHSNPSGLASNNDPINFVTYVARVDKSELVLDHNGLPTDVVMGNNASLFKGLNTWGIALTWGDDTYGSDAREGRVKFQFHRGKPSNIVPAYYGDNAPQHHPSHMFHFRSRIGSRPNSRL